MDPLPPPLTLTKVVATAGPASRDEATLAALLAAGVSIVRLNFSHGNHDDHAATIAAVRRLAAAQGRVVALLGDLQGPKLRVGDLEDGDPVALIPGARFAITSEPVLGTAARVSTSYARLGDDVRPGDRVLLDDGHLELRVESIERSAGGVVDVVCRVVVGGPLLPRKGINLPGTEISAPALTEKDRADLAFAVAQGVDLIALSFVRRPEDLRAARAELRRLGGRQPLIAKVEKPQAVARLPEIVRAADGVMVARGDLGVELSPEAVPLIQKRLIRLANAAGIPVITATQMLESMIDRPRPTRAEAADVANAILDGTDAVMLSGETAVGAYPVAAVETMVRIARAVETDPAYALACAETAALVRAERGRGRQTDAEAIAESVRALARSLPARAIAVLTRSGRTAGLVAGQRSGVPIAAFASRPEVARRLALWHGVVPIPTAKPLDADADEPIEQALRQCGLAGAGDRVVIVGSRSHSGRGAGRTVYVQVHRLGQPDAVSVDR
jgi:pyruvate kinase